LFIQNTVSYRADPGTSGGNFGIMRDHNNRSLSVTDDFRKMVQDRVAMAPVELAGRFVRQDDLGLVDQGSGYCHPLALTTGKAIGRVVDAMPQVDSFQGDGNTLRPVLPVNSGIN
jgi:hypothetical protein